MLIESYYHDTRYPVCPYTLPEILEQASEKNTNNFFTWVDPYERLTHREVYQQAMIVAKGLMAVGLKRGDTLCCFGSQGSDSLLMFLACCSLGIKFMAHYLFTPVAKAMKAVISITKPTAVMVGNIKSGTGEEHVCTEFIKLVNDLSEENSHKISHILYDRKAEKDANCTILDGWTSLSSIMKLGVETITDEMLKSAKSLVEKDEPFLYCSSSGSTGEPKFVLISAAAFANAMIGCKGRPYSQFETFGIPDMTAAGLMTILQGICSFGWGRDMVVFPAFHTANNTQVLNGILSAVEKYRINVMYYNMEYTVQFVNDPSYMEKYEISSLKCILLAGSVTTLEFKQKLMKIAPMSVDLYGGTEFIGATTANLDPIQSSRSKSIGQPAPNVEAKVVDESGAIVAIDVKGELCIRGWPLFVKYEGQPELTAKAKDKDGWYHTGDMISMDELGYIYVYGRISTAQRWKVQNQVVYSISVETVLRLHPQIRACEAIGTDRCDGAGGHDINYVVVPVPRSELKPEDVKLFAVDKMSSSIEWPVRVFFYTYDQLPKTSGSRPKVDRNKLTEVIVERVKADPSDGRV